MATHNATNPETLITVKVAVSGSNRRFKLALRDLGANVFPQRLRLLLAIPPTQAVVFERYSDSAAAYIVLDENNPSVYKQLYRAAKAKLKLRIRATLISDADGEDAGPAEAPKQYNQPPPYTSRVSLHATSSPTAQAFVSAQAASPPAPRVALPRFQRRSLIRKMQEAAGNSVKEQSVESEFREAVRPIIDEDAKKQSTTSPAPVLNANGETPTHVDYQPPFLRSSEGLFAQLQKVSEARQMAIRTKTGALPAEATSAQPSTTAKIYSGPYMCGFTDPSAYSSSYAIYCNSCDVAISDPYHFHCSDCDGGDFDLCKKCVDRGVHCGSEDHWLIKRILNDGKVINSTTEKVRPKSMGAEGSVNVQEKGADERTRTCNSCIEGQLSKPPRYLKQAEILIGPSQQSSQTATLSLAIHDFKPASDDVKLDGLSKMLLKPGRNLHHYAICDGCDKSIFGVRHKCLNCPDWDYCSDCIANARFIHPGHRFVPIYEPIKTPTTCTGKHYGIYCDGPLCKTKNTRTYIIGDRYKCAVCHDTDFCANCEASPINKHNRTHPLIKFKTPVKNVTVTTLSEKENGEEMLVMGDTPARTRSTATETTPAVPSSNAATQVQTVADLKPSEESLTREAPRPSQPPPPPPSYETAAELQAKFISDVVADCTKLPPNHVFKQTWTLLNPGPGSWPAGCSVKFVGGDSMLALDPQHVSSVTDLDNASESNILDRSVQAGERVEFTVSMRTPNREGKCISYWRLTSPSGIKFGHKLWCDVDVCRDVSSEPVETGHAEGTRKEEESTGSDTMIFPKLDKESPVSSQHESAPATTDAGTTLSPLEQLRKEEQDEMLSEVASLDDDEDDVSFLTDDEYDVLDASDEDFLIEAQNGLKK
ncbi:hypothetical protein GP486_007610 [Trichoglossum hirsutum]|uniref:ZZ-type domain-containing protein n=1 Tax=Trichoglossum hirsutum TaxID=265104 RepID=A0A9P8I617_9PEZI|nr:hypothetical protein GP486_007610 [Trichoglossum hirsutum]